MNANAFKKSYIRLLRSLIESKNKPIVVVCWNVNLGIEKNSDIDRRCYSRRENAIALPERVISNTLAIARPFQFFPFQFFIEEIES